MDIQQQRAIADSILIKLETIDPHAMLAGGAPRDWSFDHEAVDLDFYLHLTTIDVAAFHSKLFCMGLLHDQLYPSELTIAENYLETSAVRWVVSSTYQEQKVQFVVMHKPVVDSVLQHFSLSICQAWYKSQVMYNTSEFLKTIEEKTIRQLQPAFGAGYIDKILAKFPDYSFVGLSQDIEEFEF